MKGETESSKSLLPRAVFSPLSSILYEELCNAKVFRFSDCDSNRRYITGGRHRLASAGPSARDAGLRTGITQRKDRPWCVVFISCAPSSGFSTHASNLSLRGSLRMPGRAMSLLSRASDYPVGANHLSAGLDSKDGLGMGSGRSHSLNGGMHRRHLFTPWSFEMSNSTSSAEGVPAAHLPIHAGRGSSTLTSALSLRFEPIDLHLAISLNELWHSQLPKLDKRVAAWFCYGAKYEDTYFAVAVWSLPVARLLPQDGSCLELRRFALSPTAPRNSASRMLGWMARDIAGRRSEVRRLVSYQDCTVHRGTIYKASGWNPSSTPTGGDWNHQGRQRRARRIKTKLRWECFL